jgi:putative acetyltransferase
VDVQIRVERPEDAAAVRDVVLAAFASDPEVADLVEALRRSSAWRPALALVADVDGDVVGHVMASRGWLDAPDRLIDVLVLSPLSVRPDRQRAGVGSSLVNALLELAADREHEPLMFLEGDPRYYSRLGFVAAGPLGFRRPSLRIPEPAFQVRKLHAAAEGLTGTLVYPDVFWELDCVGLR